MPIPKPRYSKEEFARRGDEIYDREISPHVGPSDEGKFVVIDIETGAYELQDEWIYLLSKQELTSKIGEC